VRVPENRADAQHLKLAQSQNGPDEGDARTGETEAGEAEGDQMLAAGIGPALRYAPGGTGFSTVELFEKAVREHSNRLLAIARAIVGNRASPEDVVQQAVLNLYKHRDRYDWREPGGLLKRATVNEALRLLRQRKVGQVADDAPERRTFGPDDAMVLNETVLRVRAAIAELPEHFRAALVLCEYENMPYAQIAETLGASIPQVKTWIHRARRRLEAKLSDYVLQDDAKPKDEKDD